MFQPKYNGITADSLSFNQVARYTPSLEGKRIWTLVDRLDTSAPDRDSRRLGRLALARLSSEADALREAAARKHELESANYQEKQEHLYQLALKLVSSKAVHEADD